ncbi:S41 family peptidase [Flavobacterium aquicola]|uniref:Peptidase S41-like protein n=1 Tax=Flavobacterium aquicola TaxID=1682742 RepID=A0A3E0E471_9FLAO|nr:S41 family peptidase [Flavobacterium aquicola]REG93011.1 peptidase S41-like protein [Flavobacterium aquicola]
MKKKLLVIFILMLQCIFAQNTISENQKLEATCKIWGFLKYYHPKVANGSKNWDEQLFTILPKIENAQTKEEFSTVLENWIAEQGEIQTYEKVKSDPKIEYFTKNLDLSWTNDSKVFSKSLSKKLSLIQNNRYQGKQYYVDYESDLLKNEILYPDFKWTDKNLRLLAFFRYWNLVEYFFPYKYQMDQKWDITLQQMIPRFNNSESETDYNLALRELTVKLNDRHASFDAMKVHEYLGLKFTPIIFKIIDDKIIIVDFYDANLALENDLKFGDVITKIDGKSINEVISEKKQYVSGSNNASMLDNFQYVLLNGNADTVSVELTRDGVTRTKIINRYPLGKITISKEKNLKPEWELLQGNIGYVNIEKLSVSNLPKIMEEFKNTKAIVFDIRGYPKEVLLSLAEYLNPSEKQYARQIVPDLTYPGRFYWADMQKCGKENPDYYKGKVISLVNEKTFSQSEYLTMVLQTAPNQTIVGSQTAGADGSNIRFQIIKGFRTSFSGYGVFYPNKKETQRIGIVLDIVVKPTILGIQQGKDEVLDRAILFANGTKVD